MPAGCWRCCGRAAGAGLERRMEQPRYGFSQLLETDWLWLMLLAELRSLID